MSTIYKGKVIETTLSQNARGGTEQMRDRLLRGVDLSLLENIAIHLSRPQELNPEVKHVLWCHDLAEDPENKILLNNGWKRFEHFVFVSAWQRDQYLSMYKIPYSKCTVITNAVELNYQSVTKRTDRINFIYHTTPHRGLELLVPIFEKLVLEFPNIYLNVFSSFGLYGWQQRDTPYEPLFESIRSHPNMTYHGAVANEVVLDYLKEAHIFLYPCIWKETSCIALLEAMKSGCICIHPNYGALPETASDATYMYNFTEDLNEHATRAYHMTQHVIKTFMSDQYLFDRFSPVILLKASSKNINRFNKEWTTLLGNIVSK